MYDQSFCTKTLQRELRKRDFLGIAAVHQEAFRASIVDHAMVSATGGFGGATNPLSAFLLRGRIVYRFKDLPSDLVARKVCLNLQRATEKKSTGRTQIVAGLHLLLAEGIPYRVYRLDVKNFYESFNRTAVISRVADLHRLSPQSKSILRSIFNHHATLGGIGLPRGLSLSAALSNIMMEDFDNYLSNAEEVYYCARYVDDIIIVTSGQENEKHFMRRIVRELPAGLVLNPLKLEVVEAKSRVKPASTAADQTQVCRFAYLGYQFSVREPISIPKKRPSDHFREITVDIAPSKVKKIKTRISRSFLSFLANRDWPLLMDRLKFLTNNFSVYNSKAGGKKLAGIFHSYPQVSDDADALKDLDRFLRNAVLSRTGRIYKGTSALLSSGQRRELLTLSFVKGHAQKSFIHFSALRISEIQACWAH